MKPLATAGLVLACVYVGATFPVAALAALLAFALFGAVYDVSRGRSRS